MRDAIHEPAAVSAGTLFVVVVSVVCVWVGAALTVLTAPIAWSALFIDALVE
jgi:hypothetical protein